MKKQERAGHIEITDLNGEKIKKDNRTQIPHDRISVAFRLSSPKGVSKPSRKTSGVQQL